jgi:Icc-related predicted phosphoesterase
MIRVAAVGDLHVDVGDEAPWRATLATVPREADLLLLAGDLTQDGRVPQARALAAALRGLGIPVLAVLGNHDVDQGRAAEIEGVLRDAGVEMLEGRGLRVSTPHGEIGVAGVKGFGGGFDDACGSEFGEPEMKAFMAATRRAADALERALRELAGVPRVALLHYAPIDATLHGERPGVYPFLGSRLLEQAVDRAGADLVVHGHAHAGIEEGRTRTGIPVHNVARPVIERAGRLYRVFSINPEPARCARGAAPGSR